MEFLTTHLFDIISIAIVGIVGYVLRQQIKTQNEIIKNQAEQLKSMQSYTSTIKQYVDLFDFETVKKYMDNQKQIMNQDLEILRRRTIKQTSEKYKKELLGKLDHYMKKDHIDYLNESSSFIYHVFNNSFKKDDFEKNAIKAFPKSHQMLIDWFDQIESSDKSNDA